MFLSLVDDIITQLRNADNILRGDTNTAKSWLEAVSSEASEHQLGLGMSNAIPNTGDFPPHTGCRTFDMQPSLYT